jgi:hypothetical protein
VEEALFESRRDLFTDEAPGERGKLAGSIPEVRIPAPKDHQAVRRGSGNAERALWPSSGFAEAPESLTAGTLAAGPLANPTKPYSCRRCRRMRSSTPLATCLHHGLSRTLQSAPQILGVRRCKISPSNNIDWEASTHCAPSKRRFLSRRHLEKN